MGSRKLSSRVVEIYALLLSSLLVVLAAYFVSLLALSPLTYLIASKNLTQPLIIEKLPLYISAIPVMVHVSIPGEYFMFILAVIYLVILLRTFTDGDLSFGESIKSSVSGKIDRVFKNSFTLTTALTCFTILIIYLMSSVQERVGVPTGELQFRNLAQELLSVSYAPLNEEIGFRLTLIGFFCLVMYLYSGGGEAGSRFLLKAFFYPKLFSEHLLGDKKTYVRRVWAMIILTSAVFGLLHFLSGAGWEIGKVSTAMISGILLGYLYFYHGFPSNVVSHWIFNFVTTMTYVLSMEYEFFQYGLVMLVLTGVLTAPYFILKFLGERAASFRRLIN